VDNRKTLIDCNILSLVLGETPFYLDAEEPVGRGGTCLVYYALKMDRQGIPRKVILKEFYPLLNGLYEGELIRNADGSLTVPETVKESEIYQVKEKRFRESYEVFKHFYNEGISNNYVLQGQEFYEEKEKGTCYLVVDYSESLSLYKYIQTNPGLYDFLGYVHKLAKAAGKLHQMGYVHYDIKPDNVLVFEDGYVKFMDMDSVIKKEDFLQERKDIYLSVSDGYTAPEVMDYDGSNFSERLRFVKRGETADLYSIGAVLYAYLYGQPLTLMDEQTGVMDRSKRNRYLTERIYEKDLEEVIREKYEACPRKAVRLIRNLLRVTLTTLSGERIGSAELLAMKIEEILPLVKPGKVMLFDNFVPNQEAVFGREQKLEELSCVLLSGREKGGGRIVCVTGIGGIGKSTLAREYAFRYEDHYDMIIEVAASSALDVIGRIELLNWKDEGEYAAHKAEERDGNADFLMEKKKRIKACMKEQKTLLIVHDYNVSEDPEFGWFRELGCHIILTSRNDWCGSGIPCVLLKSEHLAPDHQKTAAKDIFLHYYCQNARESGDKAWLEELYHSMEKEKNGLDRLLSILEYHPLLIKLTAKQMAYFPGDELKPSHVLGDSRLLTLDKRDMVDFQNARDDAMAQKNAYGHLKWIYEGALHWNHLSEQEREALKYMTLIPFEYGISCSRFEKWTGLDPVWLEKLRRKGWIEFWAGRTDPLLDSQLTKEKQRGVYTLPMVVGEVITGEEGRLAREELGTYYSYIMRNINGYPSYESRNAHAAHQERLIYRLEEEENMEYAAFLEQLAYSIYVTDGSYSGGKKCIHYYEKLFELYHKLEGMHGKHGVVTCNNLAALYYEMRDLPKTEFYIRIAMGAIGGHENFEDKDILIRTMLNLSSVYMETGDLTKAHEWIEEALEQLEQVKDLAGDKKDRLLAFCYYQTGYAHYVKGNWAEAENYLADASHLAYKQKDYVFYARCMEYLAKVQRDIRDDDLSIRCFLVALDVRRKILGEGHEATDKTKKELALVCLKAERKEEAYDLCPDLKNYGHAEMIKDRDFYVSETTRYLKEGLVAIGLLQAEKALELEEFFMTPKELIEEYRTIGNLFKHYGYDGRADLYYTLMKQMEERVERK